MLEILWNCYYKYYSSDNVQAVKSLLDAAYCLGAANAEIIASSI